MLPETIRRAKGSIYHYTSSAGLLGLVENHQLWGTEATGMNDLAEVRQGWEFIREWVATKDAEDSVVSIIQYACGPDSPVAAADGLFVLCASTSPDDANQWRLYGGQGRGYAVELDASVRLSVLAREDAPEMVQDHISGRAHRKVGFADFVSVGNWMHILYTAQEKSAALDGLLKEAQARLELLESGDSDEDDVRGDEFRDELISAVATIARLMKSDGFSGENEVRTVVTMMVDACSRFRATDGGVVSYVRLTAVPGETVASRVFRDEVSSRMRLPLQSVWLGPLLDEGTNKTAIRKFLDRNSYRDAKIHVSKVLLRH